MSDVKTRSSEVANLPAVPKPVDVTQQVTSKTLTIRLKNSKKVAAGRKGGLSAQNKRCEAKKVDPPSSEVNKNVLTTTQWLGATSSFVSLVGIYYKREEKPPQNPPPSPVDNAPQAPPPSPAPKRKRGIRDMDMCEECVKNAKNIFLMTEMN